MKTNITKIISALFLFFMVSYTFAQVPQALNYQAVARNATGDLLVNQAVGIKISIHTGSAAGAVVYSEIHAPTTNNFGLFTLSIGSGTPVSGTFNTIDWSTGNYWLQVEMDPTGGVTYTDMGTSQLLTVPYAMYAKTAGSTIESKIAFYAYNTANISKTATGWVYNLPFQTELYDLGNNFTDSVFTAPVSGIYHFSVRVNFADINVETMINLSIHKNNGLIGRLDRIFSSSTISHSQSAGGSIDLHLMAGDKITIGVYMYDDDNYVISGGNLYSYFTGHLVYKD